jgi:AcrR family transcriptional regulator
MATRKKSPKGTRALRRATKGPLTRDVISEAALRLIEAHGLEEFSTRKLGSVLGCEAMAFYNHFPSKDVLLDAVVERMLAKVAVPPGDAGTWVVRARAYARSFRALARVHPRAFPLVATRRFNAPGSLALLETAFGAFLDEGFDPLTAVKIYRTLGNFLAGTVLNEISVATFAATAAPLGPRVPAEAPSALPSALPRVMPFMAPAYFEEVFEFGLDVVLDGCQRLASGKTSGSTSGSYRHAD